MLLQPAQVGALGHNVNAVVNCKKFGQAYVAPVACIEKAGKAFRIFVFAWRNFLSRTFSKKTAPFIFVLLDKLPHWP